MRKSLKYNLLTWVLLLSLASATTPGTWNTLPGPSGGNIYAIDINNSGFAVALAAIDNIFVSHDYGENWERIPQRFGDGGSSSQIWTTSEHDIYVRAGGSYRYDAQATSWETIAHPIITVLEDGTIFASDNLLSLNMSTDRGVSWKNLGIVGQPLTTSITTLSNGMIFRADKYSGGIKWTNDDGFNWYEANTGIDATDIIRIISDSNDSLYCATFADADVYKSSDYGSSWRRIYDGPRTGVIRDLDVLSNGSLVILREEPAGSAFQKIVLVSRDDGVNWEIVLDCPAGGSWIFEKGISQISTSGTNLFAATAGGLLYSSDSGKVWSYRHDGIRAHNIEAITAYSINHLYVSTIHPSKLLYKSNVGTDWDEIDLSTIRPSYNGGYFSFRHHPSGTAYYATFDTLISSSDNYQTWQGYPFTFVRDVQIDDDGTIWMGAGDGLYKSTDNGQQWTKKLPTAHRIENITLTVGSLMFAYGEGRLYRSKDNGDTWVGINNTNYLQYIAYYNGVTYTVMLDGFYRSYDDGDIWEKVSENINLYMTSSFYIGLEGTIYIGSTQGGLMLSNDGGLNWQAQNEGLPLSYNPDVGAIGLHTLVRSPDGYIFAASSSGSDLGDIYYTVDNFMSPNAPTLYPAVAEENKVSLTWSKVKATDFKLYRVYSGENENQLFVLDSTTSVNDTTISIIGLTNGTTYYFRITAVDSVGNESIFSNLVSATPTALAVEESSDIPTSFALHPAYPNPFNPNTTIRFDLPEASVVVLVVHDLLGREVARLVDRYMTAGYHQVIWDGRTASGLEVPSGIYIARLLVPPTAGITPQYTKSIKMVLLK